MIRFPSLSSMHIEPDHQLGAAQKRRFSSSPGVNERMSMANTDSPGSTVSASISRASRARARSQVRASSAVSAARAMVPPAAPVPSPTRRALNLLQSDVERTEKLFEERERAWRTRVAELEEEVRQANAQYALDIEATCRSRIEAARSAWEEERTAHAQKVHEEHHQVVQELFRKLHDEQIMRRSTLKQTQVLLHSEERLRNFTCLSRFLERNSLRDGVLRKAWYTWVENCHAMRRKPVFKGSLVPAQTFLQKTWKRGIQFAIFSRWKDAIVVSQRKKRSHMLEYSLQVTRRQRCAFMKASLLSAWRTVSTDRRYRGPGRSASLWNSKSASQCAEIEAQLLRQHRCHDATTQTTSVCDPHHQMTTSWHNTLVVGTTQYKAGNCFAQHHRPLIATTSNFEGRRYVGSEADPTAELPHSSPSEVSFTPVCSPSEYFGKDSLGKGNSIAFCDRRLEKQDFVIPIERSQYCGENHAVSSGFRGDGFEPALDGWEREVQTPWCGDGVEESIASSPTPRATMQRHALRLLSVAWLQWHRAFLSKRRAKWPVYSPTKASEAQHYALVACKHRILHFFTVTREAKLRRVLNAWQLCAAHNRCEHTPTLLENRGAWEQAPVQRNMHMLKQAFRARMVQNEQKLERHAIHALYVHMRTQRQRRKSEMVLARQIQVWTLRSLFDHLRNVLQKDRDLRECRARTVGLAEVADRREQQDLLCVLRLWRTEASRQQMDKQLDAVRSLAAQQAELAAEQAEVAAQQAEKNRAVRDAESLRLTSHVSKLRDFAVQHSRSPRWYALVRITYIMWRHMTMRARTRQNLLRKISESVRPRRCPRDAWCAWRLVSLTNARKRDCKTAGCKKHDEPLVLGRILHYWKAEIARATSHRLMLQTQKDSTAAEEQRQAILREAMQQRCGAHAAALHAKFVVVHAGFLLLRTWSAWKQTCICAGERRDLAAQIGRLVRQRDRIGCKSKCFRAWSTLVSLNRCVQQSARAEVEWIARLKCSELALTASKTIYCRRVNTVTGRLVERSAIRHMQQCMTFWHHWVVRLRLIRHTVVQKVTGMKSNHLQETFMAWIRAMYSTRNALACAQRVRHQREINLKQYLFAKINATAAPPGTITVSTCFIAWKDAWSATLPARITATWRCAWRTRSRDALHKRRMRLTAQRCVVSWRNALKKHRRLRLTIRSIVFREHLSRARLYFRAWSSYWRVCRETVLVRRVKDARKERGAHVAGMRKSIRAMRFAFGVFHSWSRVSARTAHRDRQNKQADYLMNAMVHFVWGKNVQQLAFGAWRAVWIRQVRHTMRERITTTQQVQAVQVAYIVKHRALRNTRVAFIIWRSLHGDFRAKRVCAAKQHVVNAKSDLLLRLMAEESVRVLFRYWHNITVLRAMKKRFEVDLKTSLIASKDSATVTKAILLDKCGKKHKLRYSFESWRTEIAQRAKRRLFVQTTRRNTDAQWDRVALSMAWQQWVYMVVEARSDNARAVERSSFTKIVAQLEHDAEMYRAKDIATTRISHALMDRSSMDAAKKCLLYVLARWCQIAADTRRRACLVKLLTGGHVMGYCVNTLFHAWRHFHRHRRYLFAFVTNHDKAANCLSTFFCAWKCRAQHQQQLVSVLSTRRHLDEALECMLVAYMFAYWQLTVTSVLRDRCLSRTSDARDDAAQPKALTKGGSRAATQGLSRIAKEEDHSKITLHAGTLDQKYHTGARRNGTIAQKEDCRTCMMRAELLNESPHHADAQWNGTTAQKEDRGTSMLRTEFIEESSHNTDARWNGTTVQKEDRGTSMLRTELLEESLHRTDARWNGTTAQKNDRGISMLRTELPKEEGPHCTEARWKGTTAQKEDRGTSMLRTELLEDSSHCTDARWNGTTAQKEDRGTSMLRTELIEDSSHCTDGRWNGAAAQKEDRGTSMLRTELIEDSSHCTDGRWNGTTAQNEDRGASILRTELINESPNRTDAQWNSTIVQKEDRSTSLLRTDLLEECLHRTDARWNATIAQKEDCGTSVMRTELLEESPRHADARKAGAIAQKDNLGTSMVRTELFEEEGPHYTDGRWNCTIAQKECCGTRMFRTGFLEEESTNHTDMLRNGTLARKEGCGTRIVKTELREESPCHNDAQRSGAIPQKKKHSTSITRTESSEESPNRMDVRWNSTSPQKEDYATSTTRTDLLEEKSTDHMDVRWCSSTISGRSDEQDRANQQAAQRTEQNWQDVAWFDAMEHERRTINFGGRMTTQSGAAQLRDAAWRVVNARASHCRAYVEDLAALHVLQAWHTMVRHKKQKRTSAFGFATYASKQRKPTFHALQQLAFTTWKTYRVQTMDEPTPTHSSKARSPRARTLGTMDRHVKMDMHKQVTRHAQNVVTYVRQAHLHLTLNLCFLHWMAVTKSSVSWSHNDNIRDAMCRQRIFFAWAKVVTKARATNVMADAQKLIRSERVSLRARSVWHLHQWWSAWRSHCRRALLHRKGHKLHRCDSDTNVEIMARLQHGRLLRAATRAWIAAWRGSIEANRDYISPGSFLQEKKSPNEKKSAMAVALYERSNKGANYGEHRRITGHRDARSAGPVLCRQSSVVLSTSADALKEVPFQPDVRRTRFYEWHDLLGGSVAELKGKLA